LFTPLLALSLALAVAGGLALPALAGGELVVTTGVDESDGSCSDGDCSLRDALALAANGDTITFADSYTITLNSQLEISQTVTIDGGARAITISGNNAMRVLNIQATGVVTLNHLSLIAGKVTTGSGGGIYNAGIVTLLNSTLSGNTGYSSGGGIYNDAGAVTVLSSTLSGNSLSGFPSGRGGGIYNNAGTVILLNSTLSGNFAPYLNGFGGGIFNNTGTLTMTNSSLSSSTAYSGGGVYNMGGTLAVQYSTLAGNSANWGAGGGIYSGGTLTVQHSTLSGNSSPGGGGLGGGIYSTGIATVQNSTLSGNAGYTGGGIYNNTGTLTVTNSTLSGNSGYSRGGGLFNSGTATVQNSTLSGNSATWNNGGGIYNNTGTLQLYDTIVANSAVGSDCYNGGTIALNDHNLIEDNTCSPYVSGDPVLGALADNGGQTWTMVPLTDSLAINAGNDATCLTTDQRGYGRADTCDIGAVEANALLPDMAVVGNNLVIAGGDVTPAASDGTDFGSVVVGQFLTHTFTINNSSQVTLSVSNFSLSGAAAGDFSLSGLSLPAQILPNASVTFQVRFAPTAMGARAVTLSLANNIPNKNPYDFALQGTGPLPGINVLGNGRVIADGDATPASTDDTDFGNAVAGLALTHTFTISNSGLGDLYLTGAPLVNFTGPAALDFGLVVSPTTLITSGGITTFQVRFSPMVAGLREATVTILSNDVAVSPYTFTLQGLTLKRELWLPLLNR
jgi:CSLREA domain-containing protein